MSETKRVKGESHSTESWARAIETHLRACERHRMYGTIRVEVFDGQVKRVLFERSIVSPEELAPASD